MNISISKLYFISFIVIVVIAGYLRLHDLSNNPPGFFTDEAAIGYNSYKILTIRKDEYGITLPLFFKSYGDYRLPLPIYLNLPSISLFGPTDYAVRFTAAIAGIFTVILLMYAVYQWLGRWASLGTGLSMAILPWHIHMSRWASEYIYFPLFFSIAFLLFVFFFKSKKSSYLVSSFFVFGLTMYTYYPAIFTVPIFLVIVVIVLAISFRRDKRRYSTLIISCFIYIITILPIVGSLRSGELMTRWNSLDAHKATLSIENVRRFTSFYVSHYDPKFLFVRGDENIRHAEQNYGEIHLVQAVFILYGIVFLILRKKSVVGLSIIWALCLYPLGSAITFDRLATRSIIGVIPFSILSGVGMAWFIESLRKIAKFWLTCTCIGLFVLVVSMNLQTYYHSLFVEYPTYAGTWDGFQYGFKQAIQYCVQHGMTYDDCLITHRFNSGAGLLSFYKLTIACDKCQQHPNPIVIDTQRKQLFFVRDEDIEEAKKQYPQLTFYEIDVILNPGRSAELKIGYFR